MSRPPTAVLLDVGGVFLLPSREHIRHALDQIGHTVALDETLDRAHYLAARVFPLEAEEAELMGELWRRYLETYAKAVGVAPELQREALEHLRNEYVTAALWTQVIPGSAQGLAELVATGVPIGVVSNSDGTIERRLREMGILQVGPGPGVEVRCVVDSGTVGVEKPDPRIFDSALDSLGLPAEGIWYVGDTPGFDIVGSRRAGMTPILMDPFDVNGDYGVTCVRSLGEVASLVRTY